MSRWFRFYDDAINDPKVQRLAGDTFKAWVNILCLASKHENGVLPPIPDIAFALRLSDEQVSDLLNHLYQLQLLDEVELANAPMSYTPHNWNGRQFKSDVSNERVKRHRNAKRNVTRTVTETPPETDTEQKQNRSEAAPARSADQERLGDFCQAIVSAYAEANSPTPPDTSRAGLWLTKGYDPEICVAVIKTIVKRKPNAGLAYFDGPILEAHNSRAPPRAQIGASPKQDWDGACKLWKSNGRWPKGHGPDPDSPACQCPPEILEKYMGAA